MPVSLGIEGEVLQFASLNFPDDQFAPLIADISQEIENKFFRRISNCSLNL